MASTNPTQAEAFEEVYEHLRSDLDRDLVQVAVYGEPRDLQLQIAVLSLAAMLSSGDRDDPTLRALAFHVFARLARQMLRDGRVNDTSFVEMLGTVVNKGFLTQPDTTVDDDSASGDKEDGDANENARGEPDGRSAVADNSAEG